MLKCVCKIYSFQKFTLLTLHYSQIDHLTVSNLFITHVYNAKKKIKFYYKEQRALCDQKDRTSFAKHRASLIAAFYVSLVFDAWRIE